MERRVLVWGVRSEATDAPPRAQPRRGTAGDPLVKKLSHNFMDTLKFTGGDKDRLNRKRRKTSCRVYKTINCFCFWMERGKGNFYLME